MKYFERCALPYKRLHSSEDNGIDKEEKLSAKTLLITCRANTYGEIANLNNLATGRPNAKTD